MTGTALLRRSGASVAVLERRLLPRRVILLVLPRAVERRFDPASACDLTAEFELCVREPGRPAPARFTVSVDAGRCRVRPGAAQSPGAVIELSTGDMIRLASGAAGWPQMLSAGRLQLSGDPFLALRFPSLFRLSVGSG